MSATMTASPPLPPDRATGTVVAPQVNVARHTDLIIGVMPIINLEWIRKLHRDKPQRGYSTEAVADTILRRMPDYVNCICPQFAETDINFQRVPTVDTSNRFIALMVIEALVLQVWWRRLGHGIATGHLLASLLAGFFLLLALRGR